MLLHRIVKICAGVLLLSALSACATGYDNGPNIDTNHLNVYSSLHQRTIWSDITDNFDLLPSHPYPSAINLQLQWYQRHQHYFDLVTTNAGPYIQYIYQQTQERHLPAELALLPMVESAYDPFLYSRVGAIGLWQLMPGTGAGFGLQINWWYDGRRDIVQSTRAALDYLTYLHDYFDNDWLLAIAAYNSGEGTVQQAIMHNRARGLPIDFWDLPLPPETRVYVPKLLALAIIINNPSAYGFSLPKIPATPYFDAVTLERQMDLTTIANLAGIPQYVVHVLNPGCRRPSTPPGKNFSVLLPTYTIAAFQKNIDATPDTLNSNWVQHTVTRNESLLSIARQYKTTTDAIMRVNHLQSHIVHPGQNLLVPKGIKNVSAVSAASTQQLPQQFGIQQHSNINEDALPGPQQFVHVVERGETLGSIAQRYHVPASQIAFWNNLNADAVVHRGQSLSMWLSPRHYAALTAPPSFRYTVRRGDTLSGIAAKFHTTTAAIKQTNRLRSNFLRLNQTLLIPGHSAPVYKPTAKVASRKYIQAHTAVTRHSARSVNDGPRHTITHKTTNKIVKSPTPKPRANAASTKHKHRTQKN